MQARRLPCNSQALLLRFEKKVEEARTLRQQCGRLRKLVQSKDAELDELQRKYARAIGVFGDKVTKKILAEVATQA